MAFQTPHFLDQLISSLLSPLLSVPISLAYLQLPECHRAIPHVVVLSAYNKCPINVHLHPSTLTLDFKPGTVSIFVPHYKPNIWHNLGSGNICGRKEGKRKGRKGRRKEFTCETRTPTESLYSGKVITVVIITVLAFVCLP